jgi:glycine/D-amino acid oxidase-like deaminating enzyme
MAGYDVVIVGGGAMGSAAAYYLKSLASDVSVAVVEKDPSYEYCSTLRSDGNLRIQFNLEENIRMSQYTLELLDSFADDMEIDGWRPDPAPKRQGNLFLAGDDEARAHAESGMEAQRALGCDVEWLDAAMIAERWPAYRTAGVVGGTFGPGDGAIDPNAVLHAFRRNAARLGAVYVTGEVAAIEIGAGEAAGVRLAAGERLEAPVVINCAGGWATQLARDVGVDLPVVPVMRTVFTVESTVDGEGLPSIFTPGGAYVIAEGGNTFSMAWSRESDPVGFDFTFSRAGFNDVVWPEIIATLPAFDQLEVSGGWTGIYAVNTFDGNAILGEWPEIPGLFLANGFSGHGFQHCPAMGRHIAQLVLGREPSLDLARFGPKRILDGTPVPEHAGRII